MKIDKDSVKEKLLTYILNYKHEQGQHKARVFESVLNVTQDDYKILMDALEKAIQQQTAIALGGNKYGQKYQLNFEMENQGKKAKICSIWMVRNNEISARLVTCYVLI